MRRLFSLTLAVLLLLLVLVPPAMAASVSGDVTIYPGVSIRFEHLMVDDGLSQNTILALLQDRRGYLWIGTQDGLNRYDGYTFTQFKNDPQNPNSISYNSVIALYEDVDGYLWVGTWGGGLNRYDPDTGNFSRYLPDPSNPASLSNAVVTSLAQGENGNLWVGTLGGLDSLDPTTGEFIHFHSDSTDPSTLSSDAISVITAAGDGSLWIGTGAFGTQGNGLNRFDPATGRAEHIISYGLCQKSPNISAIQTDLNGGLWIGHGGSGLPGGGLDYFSPTSGSCYHYDSDTYLQFTDDNITGLLLDQDNFLWIAVRGGGLLYAEPDSFGRFTSIHHKPGDPASLSSDSASVLMQDRSGVLWVGTFDLGINKLNLESLRFRTYKNDPTNSSSLASDRVSAFAETTDGTVWIGTSEAGLDRFNYATGQFTHYRAIPGDPESISSNQIRSLYADLDGTLWIGTVNNGLSHFDPLTGKFYHYRHDPADPASLVSDEVTYITRDSKGGLWVATMGGLSRLDLDSEQFVNYSKLNSAPVALTTNGGDLWIGTWGGGVSRLSFTLPGILPPEETRLTTQLTLLHDDSNSNSLSENYVGSIYKTSEGLFWFGTVGGLNRYDPRTGDFKIYNENNGFHSATILGIVEDPNGYLWITTANGLVRFDPAAETTRVYDQSDGLQGDEFNPNACFLSPTTGNIYIGGSNGFTVFNPLKIVSNTSPPTAIITDFRVFSEPYSFDPQGETPVKLNYRQNFISFDFASLDFHVPTKNSYAYMLEGFDDTWIRAGAGHVAVYADLPVGEYIFRVRVANSDGIWSATDATLHIQIAPPFWQRWQFQVGLILLLVGLVVGGFRWRERGTRKNARILEQCIAERTEELNKINELLREKAAQDAVSAERTRLARELHDAVTQTLFSATLIAEVLPDLWKTNVAEGNHRLEELRQLTRGALAEMRTLLVELRPNALVEVPLPTLLRQFTEALKGRARIDIRLDSGGERKLPANVQICLYRIAQEALNNVVKHAQATQAVVTLEIDDVVRMTIDDNGMGFDPSAITADHLGLRIMRERAEAIGAKFSIDSKPGKGTQISVIWLSTPLNGD
ncbi:MAG: two-component regulator propeller domain-containing protein [Chloroflexota bacterium]